MRTFLMTGTLFLALAGAACAGPRVYAYRVAPPPPPPRVVMGVAPGPGHVWCDGFYDLRGGRWVWVPGYWARAPRGRAVWVAPAWQPHGNGWRFRAGYWR